MDTDRTQNCTSSSQMHTEWLHFTPFWFTTEKVYAWMLTQTPYENQTFQSRANLEHCDIFTFCVERNVKCMNIFFTEKML